MMVNVTDSQIVGETTGVLFTIIQPAPIDALVILKNSGTNTMNYNFQEWTGSAWGDIGTAGSDFQNTLSANQVKSIVLPSSNSKVQLVGNASGGTFLDFTVTRYFDRADRGPVPILNL